MPVVTYCSIITYFCRLKLEALPFACQLQSGSFGCINFKILARTCISLLLNFSIYSGRLVNHNLTFLSNVHVLPCSWSQRTKKQILQVLNMAIVPLLKRCAFPRKRSSSRLNKLSAPCSIDVTLVFEPISWLWFEKVLYSQMSKDSYQSYLSLFSKLTI